MLNKNTDEELIFEIKKRGLFDNDGLIKWPVYQIGVDILPIICVDLIPVKVYKDEYKIGIIQRATGPEAGKMAITGGRIKRDQKIVDAISRHLNDDLSVTSWSFFPGVYEYKPFFVQQYFNEIIAQGDYGYDPTKHSIALTYLVKTSTDPKPKNEATKFQWIKEEEIPENTAYNHKVAMKQAFEYLKSIK